MAPWFLVAASVALGGCAFRYQSPENPVNIRGKWEYSEETMANLTDNGSTNWFEIPAGEWAIAEAHGSFGSGTIVIEMQSTVDTANAITVEYPPGSSYDGTTEFAVPIHNRSGRARKFRLTLSGATSPDIDVTIE